MRIYRLINERISNFKLSQKNKNTIYKTVEKLYVFERRRGLIKINEDILSSSMTSKWKTYLFVVNDRFVRNKYSTI